MHNTMSNDVCIQSAYSDLLKSSALAVHLPSMVDTGKGQVSQGLFDFAVSIDAHKEHKPEWILKCLAVFAANKLTEKHDLIDLKDEDYDASLEEYALEAGQKAWLRRCIKRANSNLAAAVAERGEAAPANSEASAIRALVETIKNEEV